MARLSDNYIDVDTTTLKPSPQRIRNILTLEERVAAIRAYDNRPMYTKVAKMFNCSWEQIKNIIANRSAILEFYEATKNAKRLGDPQLNEMRRRNIEFLGDCVYEYIQRIQFHTKCDLTEELIRCQAYEFREVIGIDNFIPNKAWINQFKAKYNFSLSNRQITLTRTPPASLDVRDILTYCTRMKAMQGTTPRTVSSVEQPLYKHAYRTSTQIALSHENDSTVEELRQRRQRKLNFLERALLEFATRAKFHLKVTLDIELLSNTAASLGDMLKLDNFQPNAEWLKDFKRRYDFETLVENNLSTSTRTPPLSLDLKDILSYCSRLEKNIQIGAIDNARKLNNSNKTLRSNTKHSQQLTPTPTSRTPVISIVPKAALMSRKKLSNGNAIQNNSLRDVHKPLQEFKTEIIDLDENVIKLEPTNESNVEIKRPNRNNCRQPALKIRKIESMCTSSNETQFNFMPKSPGHWSETSDKNEKDEEDDDDDDEVKEEGHLQNPLPKTVRTYEDALKLLKPLEEFAMLEENYRAIGLLEQLESIFKNPPKQEDED